MTITHIFFDVHDVLVDRARLKLCYATNLGRIMAQRYGSTAVAWEQANHHVVADWDSYYADLNLSGDDGIADMWEGIFRTTRALFRLVGVPEPPKDELIALSRELPGLAANGCDVLYPEVPEVLAELDAAGLLLGAVSHALVNQIRAALAPVLHRFKAPVWGADNAERFDKDVERYRFATLAARAAPECCLVIDDKREPLLNAQAAGMQTIRVDRNAATPEAGVLPDLRGVIDFCLHNR